jgi:hypothetical protein
MKYNDQELGAFFYIYPEGNGSKFLIKREFFRSMYCIDSLIIGDTILNTSRIDYSNNKIKYQEVIYQNNKVSETKDYLGDKYYIQDKKYYLKDSLEFTMTYYENGYLKSCYISQGSCKINNGFEFNPSNTEYSTGYYSEIEPVDSLSVKPDCHSTLRIIVNCGEKTGTWYTYDLYSHIVDSTKYK